MADPEVTRQGGDLTIAVVAASLAAAWTDPVQSPMKMGYSGMNASRFKPRTSPAAATMRRCMYLQHD